MKNQILYAVVIASMMSGPVFAMGDKSFVEESEWQKQCAALNSNSKPHKYFEGVLTKGYLVPAEPIGFPTGKKCGGADAPCLNNDSHWSYALNLKGKHDQLISLWVPGTRQELKKYGFKEGDTYGVCYTLNAIASEKNKREIWYIENLDRVQRVEK